MIVLAGFTNAANALRICAMAGFPELGPICRQLSIDSLREGKSPSVKIEERL